MKACVCWDVLLRAMVYGIGAAMMSDKSIQMGVPTMTNPFQKNRSDDFIMTEFNVALILTIFCQYGESPLWQVMSLDGHLLEARRPDPFLNEWGHGTT